MADVGFSVAGWRKGKLLGYGRGLSDRQGFKVYVSPYVLIPVCPITDVHTRVEHVTKLR